MKVARSLLVSCTLIIAMAHSVPATHIRRQASSGTLSTPTTTSLATPTSTPPPSLTTQSTSDTSNTNPPQTPSATQPPPPDTSKSTTPVTPINSPTTPPPDIPPNTSQLTSAGASETTIVTVTGSLTSSGTSSSASSSTTKAADDGDGDSSLGTGSIIGISVAGGVAVIAIVAFLVWKFTRKRFTTFDDNEPIKWPELNAHSGNQDSHPLPVHNTGRSGFDTGSEVSLSRVPSASNYSHPDVSGGIDPYAVPPLPHMNPNQPYRDDPTAASAYYDPYRGPVPGTLEHGAGVDDWPGENIPMTQMAGRASPGPHAAYDVGRQSPGPQAAYGRTASPGPHTAYGGRASPGAQAAFNSGRMSPGAQASFDLYGGRQ